MPNLDIKITANGAQANTVLRSLRNEVLSFSNVLKAGFTLNLGAQLANGVLSLGRAFSNGVRDAEQFAGQLNDQARAANLSVEAYQVLARQAKLTGAEMGDVTKMAVELGEKTRDAILGNGGAAGAFVQLGIDVAAFAQLAPERQIEAIGAALVNARDPAAAFSAVIELLGTKTAPKLRAVLEDLGTNGLDKLSADMANAGLLMRDGVIAELDNAGDKSEDLATKFRVAWANAAVALQPVFNGLRRMGIWLADSLSWVALRLEKIMIAASSIGTMTKDIVTGNFKGFAFYNEQAERLSKAAEDRAKQQRNAPLAESKGGDQKPPVSNDELVRSQSKEKLNDVADKVERAQRQASIDLASISRNFAASSEERRVASLSVLRTQAKEIAKAQQQLDALIDQLARADSRFDALQKASPKRGVESIAEDLTRGPKGNKELAAAMAARERLTDAQSANTQRQLDANQDPQTMFEGAQSAFAQLRDQLGTGAQSMAQAISGSLNSALQGTSDLLYNISSGAMTFSQAWGAATMQVGQQFLRMVTDMVTKMIWRATIERGLIALGVMTHVTGETAKTAATTTGAGIRIALTIKEALASVYHGAIEAFKAMASIPYVGPFLGAAAMAAALAGGIALVSKIGGFEQGGIITGGEQIVRVNEAGTESVLNARATSFLGKSGVDALNNGQFFSADALGPYSSVGSLMQGGGVGGGGPSGGGTQLLQPVLVGSMAEAETIRRGSKAEVQILELVRANRYQIFGRKHT